MIQSEKILITGASGFTAPYISTALKLKGFETVGIGQSESPPDGIYDGWTQVDLTQREQVEKAVAEISPDYVVHLAGISFVGHADLTDFYRVNVVGTENLLNSLDSLSPLVKGVLIASSANVYGSPSDITYIDESQPPGPTNHYAISKLAMEFAAKKFMSSLPIVIARPFNYIGYGQSKSFVVPKIVAAHADRQPEIKLGALDVSRDFTAVQDTVEAYAKLLFEERAMGETVNVCSSRAYSLSQILNMVGSIAGYEIRVTTDPNLIRKHEIKKLMGSNKKLTDLTGWSPNIAIEEVLKQMLSQYRTDAGSFAVT